MLNTKSICKHGSTKYKRVINQQINTTKRESIISKWATKNG